VGAAVLRVVTCCAVLPPRSVKGRKYLIGRLSPPRLDHDDFLFLKIAEPHAMPMFPLNRNPAPREKSQSPNEPPQLNKANKKTKTHELLFVGRSQTEGS